MKKFTLKLDCFDDYTWVRKVILSCQTKEQNDNAYELINLFYRKYSNLALSLSLIGLSVEIEQKIKLNEITD
jgi:hypothetical protein